jgi:hypothetical protein
MMFHPLGNSTVLPAAGWHPEPRTRGTFSILSSCLITMSLCIWTSLHLNLPGHKKEHLQKYRKLGWMMLGLIAPEMVVWNAWEQRKKMKEVSKGMQKKGFMPVRPTPWIRVRDEITKAWHWMLACLLLKAKDWPELADPTPYGFILGLTYTAGLSLWVACRSRTPQKKISNSCPRIDSG